MTSPKTPTTLQWRSELVFTGLRFKKRERTDGITIHCSASKPNQNWGAVEIDRMHRSHGWLCIGYHFVIDREGVIHQGRPMDVKGAHCKHDSRNDTHVSICLVGGVSARPKKHVPGSPWNGSDAEANFTPAQIEALTGLKGFLQDTYGLTDEDVEGHRDVRGVRKACPSFNVRKWIETGKVSLD